MVKKALGETATYCPGQEFCPCLLRDPAESQRSWTSPFWVVTESLGTLRSHLCWALASSGGTKVMGLC